MHLKTRNVNSAFHTLVGTFHTKEYQSEDGAWGRIAGEPAPIVSRSSRNGNVFMIDEPVTITYTNPRERVLFNEARDANPFFHLYEALWMLAGRNDVDSVAFYASKMREFSDDGRFFNGAYGRRWRWAEINDPHERASRLFTDQLKLIISLLRSEPTSRRAVLQMWNVEDDLLKVGSSKDVCCNLNVMFSLRKDGPTAEDGVSCQACVIRNRAMFFTDPGPCHVCGSPYGGVGKAESFLDMTVTNRSNDMIWGMLGTNYVHFTMLQEYMAAQLGVEVGVYHHFTNNLHVYDWNWKPEEWLQWNEAGDIMSKWPEFYGYDTSYIGPDGDSINPEVDRIKPGVHLVKDPERFEKEVQVVVEHFNGNGRGITPIFVEPFIDGVVVPMFTAFSHYKQKDMKNALRWCDAIRATDWRIACTRWLQRRVK